MSRYNVGRLVTIQEVLYEKNDVELKSPIVYPGHQSFKKFRKFYINFIF